MGYLDDIVQAAREKVKKPPRENRLKEKNQEEEIALTTNSPTQWKTENCKKKKQCMKLIVSHRGPKILHNSLAKADCHPVRDENTGQLLPPKNNRWKAEDCEVQTNDPSTDPAEPDCWCRADLRSSLRAYKDGDHGFSARATPTQAYG